MKRGCEWLFVALIAFILLGIAIGPMTGSIEKAKALQTGYSTVLIALFLNRYAADHQGRYPSGNSSTEIFQQLLDQQYVHDPRIFYSQECIGKVAPPTRDSYQLKPENVCYDITVSVNGAPPKNLPLVMETGYRITYLPGATAVPLSNAVKDRNPCMAVDYNNGAFAIFRNATWFGIGEYFSQEGDHEGYRFDKGKGRTGGRLLRDGTITNFVSSDFDPGDTTFQQLTPDGPLPH